MAATQLKRVPKEALRVLLVGMGMLNIAHAHHSSAGIFDRNQTIEIEGVLSAALWRNPHVILTVDVLEPNGSTVEWTIEGSSLGVLRARGLDPAAVAIGDRVTVAGFPSLRGRRELWANNLLLPSGQEILVQPNGVARWPKSQGPAVAAVDEATRQRALRTADGIFRVWSTVFDDPDSFPMFSGSYPLTTGAIEKRAQWDPLDNERLSCAPKNMPRLMGNPLPIEFTRRDGNIVIRLEETDSERIIYMAPDAAERSLDPSRFGYSTGRWEGDALIVTTRSIESGYFDLDGTPQSGDIELEERFVVGPTGERLDYSLVVNDAQTFTTPVTLKRYWVWRPEIELRAFYCDASYADRVKN